MNKTWKSKNWYLDKTFAYRMWTKLDLEKTKKEMKQTFLLGFFLIKEESDLIERDTKKYKIIIFSEFCTSEFNTSLLKNTIGRWMDKNTLTISNITDCQIEL